KLGLFNMLPWMPGIARIGIHGEPVGGRKQPCAGVAGGRHRPYLEHVQRRELGLEPRLIRPHGCPMSQLSSSLHALPRPLMAVGVAVTLLVAAAVALWVHYGTAVFYEMIAAGVAWCL